MHSSPSSQNSQRKNQKPQVIPLKAARQQEDHIPVYRSLVQKYRSKLSVYKSSLYTTKIWMIAKGVYQVRMIANAVLKLNQITIGLNNSLSMYHVEEGIKQTYLNE